MNEHEIKCEIDNTNTDQLIRKIATDVSWIKLLLRGNGEPQKGWIVRFDRMEQFVASSKWLLAVIVVALIGVLTNMVLR